MAPRRRVSDSELMATSGPTQLSVYTSTNAQFQAWVQAVQAAIAAVGTLAYTSDTGMINSATVAVPAATNTSAGYEIYKFQDSLQTTAPIFIKIEYGVAGAVTMPTMWVTVGTGSNGSGTLTGQVTTRQICSGQTNGTSGQTFPLYMCGQPSGIACMFGYGVQASNNSTCFWSVERTHNSSGVATADGIICALGCNAYNGAYTAVVPFSGSVPGGNDRNIMPGPYSLSNNGNNGTISYGSNVGLVPAMLMQGQIFFSLMLVVYASAVISQLISFAVTNLGQSLTYIGFYYHTAPCTDGTSAGQDAIAMLWQ